jgi:hypothetical protein
MQRYANAERDTALREKIPCEEAFIFGIGISR